MTLLNHGQTSPATTAFRLPQRKRRSPRRYFYNGRRAAVLRALTAARLYCDARRATLADAAASCGSCIPYVKAANVLLRHEATHGALILKVVHGEIPLLTAAAQLRCLDTLVATYHKASTAERVEFAAALGVDVVWDQMILPIIAQERAAAVNATT
jgi:hypothetical protein